MAVSRRLRFEVLRRDGHTCRYCGAKAPDVTLTVDHVVPVALGGGDEPNNLVTACQECNSGKASTPADAAMVEDVDATALLFAKAAERAAAERLANVRDIEAIQQDFYNRWTRTFSTDDDLDLGWDRRLEQFLGRGLVMEDFDRFIYATATAWKLPRWKRWNYFCGCGWNAISDIEERARQLIEDGHV